MLPASGRTNANEPGAAGQHRSRLCHPDDVRTVCLLIALSIAAPLAADDRIPKLLARLAEQASTFEHTAPHLVSEETLQQSSLKPGKPRASELAGARPAPRGFYWQQREIKSEYVFAAAGTGSNIREVRRVISVDGKPAGDSGKEVDRLFRAIRSNDEKSRRKLLEDFEKYGLTGTVTDFGQLLLLFALPNQERYSFQYTADRLMGAEPCHVFSYKEQDGPGALTVWGGRSARTVRVSGEIWVKRNTFDIMRITLNSIAEQAGDDAVRQSAAVDYINSAGCAVPASVVHRQFRGPILEAENRFTYQPFHRFGASTNNIQHDGPKP